ncbi:hypothetical protein RJT34_09493 [Clitoria ternatea]|uniref:ZCF37 n=1 Tax=Clitoria ternatea TaxID=43366 RepID=A0AAN9K7J0_CLITE
MLNHFACGTFHHQDLEDGGPCSSPKKPKRKDSKRDKNPYSNRGLDKFSELMADLDQKRQELYSQMNPHDISFVRFTYSKNDDFVPIVVKVRNKEQKKHKSEELKVRHFAPFLENSEAIEDGINARVVPKSLKVNKNCGFSWNLLKRPSFYMPVVVILILVLLTVFGRSFATLCTCVVWYAVPTLSDDNSLIARKVMKKKKEGLSEKKIVNNASEGLFSLNDETSGKHAHQKSW